MALCYRNHPRHWLSLGLCALLSVPLSAAAAGAPSEPRMLSQQRENVDARYVGCFKDTSAFDLDGHLERSASNTPWRCVETCEAKGFKYAAVQYGESCLCGNSYGRYGPATNCDYRCTGDGGEICGGYSANSVFWTGDRNPAAPPPPPPPAVPGHCGPADAQIEYGTNRFGGDYKRFNVSATSCPQQCATACAKDEQCQAWSFVRAGEPKAGCYLKKSQPAPTQNACCDSGTKAGSRVRDWTEPR